jgi:hypothetical protein
MIMNTRILFAVLILLLPTCKGYDDIEFDPSPIPGEYTGELQYFTSVQGGGLGDNLPDMSKSYGFNTTITKAGSNYTMSFDKSFKYIIPDLSIEITTVTYAWGSHIAMIRPVVGEEYSLDIRAPGTLTTNYISVNTINRQVYGSVELKSNDPDSVYFLHLYFGRSY